MALQIITYMSDDYETPPHMAACATLVLPQQTNGKRAFTPTWTVHAATPAEARAKLEKFWADQQPKPREPRR